MLTWFKVGIFSQSESSILHVALNKFNLNFSAGVENLNLVYLGGGGGGGGGKDVNLIRENFSEGIHTYFMLLIHQIFYHYHI